MLTVVTRLYYAYYGYTMLTMVVERSALLDANTALADRLRCEEED